MSSQPNMDWKVGDLAVCVDAGARVFKGGVSDRRDILCEGQAYRVIHYGIRDDKWGTFPALRLAEFSWHSGFDADRFRKIRPDEHEACEAEFRILLNLSKKRVGA